LSLGGKKGIGVIVRKNMRRRLRRCIIKQEGKKLEGGKNYEKAKHIRITKNSNKSYLKGGEG